MSSAQALKEEADALFRQQDYQAAFLKYHEAIKIDDKNPVLFANRALCALKMEFYLDVIHYATSAIKLDPAYVKAHTYLARAQSALHQYSESEESWQNALKALPFINLTPQELVLKQACENGYTECRKHIRDVKAQVEGQMENTREYPIFRRVAVLTEHMSEEEICQPTRSYYHVARASTIYQRATNMIQVIVHRSHCRGHGVECPLMGLVDALQYDDRVAHTWDITWLEKVVALIDMVDGALQGWKDIKPDDKFRSLVRERIAQEGWEGTRMVLAASVKSWIIHAMMLESPGSEERARYLSQAIEVIKWVSSFVLPSGDLQKCHCCGIFKPTFLVATQKLHLIALMQVATEKRADVAAHNQLLNSILQEADEILEVANGISREKTDEIHMVAYKDFPCGVAWAAKGYYYWEQARNHQSSKTDFQHYLRTSSEHYLKASSYFPEDDEYHWGYLQRVLECKLFCGATAREQLHFSEVVHKAAQKMKPIWGIGVSTSSKIMVHIAGLVATIFKVGVARGRVKLDDVDTWDYPHGALFITMMANPPC